MSNVTKEKKKKKGRFFFFIAIYPTVLGWGKSKEPFEIC